MEYIEVSAKTIDDALTEASIKLGTTFYEPTENGYEKNIKEYLERIRK